MLSATMALLAPAAVSAAPPTLFWASTGVPGETLVIGKSGDCPAPCTCTVTALTAHGSEAATEITLEPAQINNASLMLALPASLPLGAYSIVAGGSAPLQVNAPDMWWIQGDSGNVSSTSGWLRVFGRNIALGAAADAAKERLEAQDAADAIAAAARRGDFEAAERLAAAQTATARAALSGPHPTLTLTDAVTDAALPPIAASNASSVEALFMLSAVPPGTYHVSLSNGYASSGLDSFVSPATPHLKTLTVVSAASVEFDSKLFTVSTAAWGGVSRWAAFPQQRRRVAGV
eukprot:COSAG04_NODE_352_length_16097_cov_3.125328_12_plen_290_part_00